MTSSNLDGIMTNKYKQTKTKQKKRTFRLSHSAVEHSTLGAVTLNENKSTYMKLSNLVRINN